jgi:anti-repressor protein
LTAEKIAKMSKSELSYNKNSIHLRDQKMSTLPALNKNQTTMSSIEIAELTGKLHKNVLRDIRGILSELYPETKSGSDLSSLINQGVTVEFDDHTRLTKQINLSRDLVENLLMRYSAPLRAKVIARLRELEEDLKSSTPTLPTNFLEALEALVASEKEKIEVLTENARLKHRAELDEKKVAVVDAIKSTDGLMTIGEVARLIGIGKNTLFAKLRADRWLMNGGKFRDKAKHNLPYQILIDQGVFEVKVASVYEDDLGEAHINLQTMVTGKGVIVLTRKYKIITIKKEAA